MRSTKRWVDLLSDDEPEQKADQIASSEESTKAAGAGSRPAVAAVGNRPSGRPCWADLMSEDEQEEVCSTAPPMSDEEVEEVPAPVESDDAADAELVQPARPRFARITREQRLQQVQKTLDEFLELDFDSVEAEEQPGVVHRMLATLKSLACADIFWQDGAKQEVDRYVLLGFQEDDMYAIADLGKKADKHSEKRAYRKAYEVLAKAKPWFRGGDLTSLRAEWSLAKAEKQQKKDAKREEKQQKKDAKREEKQQKKDAKREEKQQKKDAKREEKQQKKDAKREEKQQKKDAKREREEVRQDGEPALDWQVVDTKRKTAASSSSSAWPETQRKTEHTLPPWKRAAPQAPAKASGTTAAPQPETSTAPRRAPAPAPAHARSRPARGNTQCQFYIGIEEEPDFSVVRKVLGRHGCNMKRIAEETGSKLRLRGRGSGFKEGLEYKESSDPLMLCISAPDTAAYARAKELMTELLEDVYRQYRSYCRRVGIADGDVSIQVHEGYRTNGR
eukprot:CAMPEP_0178466972 /NCGR_PEP_ID=MMETSP0689_2-20121128/52177_1 /TAXON_ID=160604 /ORGANISM="Amphidinium massartii, Strain CS-259" /LENGTH=503 /DNA_ID=CAMNT_0020094009 /DNA_START=1 /DNA_END=1517 /DNA_ORIENTATION=+